MTFFTVERTDGTFMPSTDVLGCGMGQWGGLGNGLYTTSQGDPSRVQAISGLLECMWLYFAPYLIFGMVILMTLFI